MDEDTDMQTAPDVVAPAQDLDDIEEDLEDDLHWVLGFPEPALHPCDMLRHAFPSKVGGRPAWLDPLRLPSVNDLRCPVDGSIMRFLLQVYAPVEEQPEAFHRTMFVFVSGKAKSLHGSPPGVRALRCQMPRKNEFYVYDPLTDHERLAGPSGVAGSEGVVDPWGVSAHEQDVVRGSGGFENTGTSTSAHSKYVQHTEGQIQLFPEYEIVIEEEAESNKTTMATTEQQIEEAKLAELSNSNNNYTEEELPSDLIDELEKNMPIEKRHFASFAARISNAPSQILRYCFEEGSAPICPSPHGIPEAHEIPACEHCGAPRKFEFQIMPQVLNILGIDPSDDEALDFGTIAVYSCSRSCGGLGYTSEYVWVQK